MVTLTELKERLAEQVDEITLLEVLNIKADDIVEAFQDRIEERMEQLTKEYFEGENDNNCV